MDRRDAHCDAIVVRRAAPGDAPELARLREVMFDAMGQAGASTSWREVAAGVFESSLATGRMIGYVVDDPEASGRLAASGVVEYEQRLPSPANPTGAAAYISNVSTDAAWRRRGFARAITTALLDDARGRGITKIALHATPDGIDLYRSLGFVERQANPEMRWAGVAADQPGEEASGT